MRITRVVATLLLVAGTWALGSAAAGAEPAGHWQREADLLPSGTSQVGFPSLPVQLSEVGVTEQDGAVSLTSTPYLAPWAHDLVPIDSGAAVDLRGSIVLSAPGVNIDIAGHCIFAGEGTRFGETRPVPSPALVLGDTRNGLHIEPQLHMR